MERKKNGLLFVDCGRGEKVKIVINYVEMYKYCKGFVCC